MPTCTAQSYCICRLVLLGLIQATTSRGIICSEGGTPKPNQAIKSCISNFFLDSVDGNVTTYHSSHKAAHSAIDFRSKILTDNEVSSFNLAYCRFPAVEKLPIVNIAYVKVDGFKEQGSNRASSPQSVQSFWFDSSKVKSLHAVILLHLHIYFVLLLLIPRVLFDNFDLRCTNLLLLQNLGQHLQMAHRWCSTAWRTDRSRSPQQQTH